MFKKKKKKTVTIIMFSRSIDDGERITTYNCTLGPKQRKKHTHAHKLSLTQVESSTNLVKCRQRRKKPTNGNSFRRCFSRSERLRTDRFAWPYVLSTKLYDARESTLRNANKRPRSRVTTIRRCPRSWRTAGRNRVRDARVFFISCFSTVSSATAETGRDQHNRFSRISYAVDSRRRFRVLRCDEVSTFTRRRFVVRPPNRVGKTRTFRFD